MKTSKFVEMIYPTWFNMAAKANGSEQNPE